MAASPYHYPPGADVAGDDIVFRCSAFALGCGAVGAAIDIFGCSNDVLSFFAPDLSYLLLAPAALIAMLGVVGLCASCRFSSKLFRAQLGILLFILAVVLACMGVWVTIASQDIAQWVSDGCEGHETLGKWAPAGRIASKMRLVYDQHEQLKRGFERCRALNPLVYDLSDCGIRAKIDDGSLASSIALYSWFRRVQLRFACGGLCVDEVPLFGSTTMAETPTPRTNCASMIDASTRTLGQMLGGVGALLALPVVGVSFALFCAARRSDDDFHELDLSDNDDDTYGASLRDRGAYSGAYDSECE